MMCIKNPVKKLHINSSFLFKLYESTHVNIVEIIIAKIPVTMPTIIASIKIFVIYYI
jgi:hypothetical protein